MAVKGISILKGEKLCLRCKHLYVKTDDLNKRICECGNPFLVNAEEIRLNGIAALRRKHNFKE